MQSAIHKTAIVGDNVKIGRGVTIGPYAIIEDHVIIGDDCVIGPRATIHNYVEMGKGNRISGFADVGGDAQDVKFTGFESWLRLGDGNTVREFVTLHRSSRENGATLIGDRNFFMAYTHVAHDCVIGSDVTVVNYAALSGHVEVEDHAFISGAALVHQFVKIGRYTMIGGASRVTQDVIPYTLVNGAPPALYGLNIVGLRRAGFDRDVRGRMKEALSVIMKSGGREELLSGLKEIAGDDCPQITHIIDFIGRSERGLVIKRHE